MYLCFVVVVEMQAVYNDQLQRQLRNDDDVDGLQS